MVDFTSGRYSGAVAGGRDDKSGSTSEVLLVVFIVLEATGVLEVGFSLCSSHILGCVFPPKRNRRPQYNHAIPMSNGIRDTIPIDVHCRLDCIEMVTVSSSSSSLVIGPGGGGG